MTTDQPATCPAIEEIHSLLADAKERVEDWQAAAKDVFQSDEMTSALLRGAYAAEELSAKFSDCPYKGRQWKWAWRTGFDLGRRIDGWIAIAGEMQRQKNTTTAALAVAEGKLETVKTFLVGVTAGPRGPADPGWEGDVRFGARIMDEAEDLLATLNRS